jgi:hypothetical protein
MTEHIEPGEALRRALHPGETSDDDTDAEDPDAVRAPAPDPSQGQGAVHSGASPADELAAILQGRFNRYDGYDSSYDEVIRP